MGSLKSNLSKTFRYVNDNGDEIILDYAHGFLINKPAGIDTVQVSLSQAQGINQTGATVQSVNVQPRPVNVSGRLVGDFQDENKINLVATVRPDIGGRLYADDYYIVVKPTATPTVSPAPRFADFQFSILAPYPYWQKDDSVQASLSGVEPRFKFPWNVSRPYRFGEVIKKQFINVTNGGQVPVPFTVTFIALDAVTNPKITDVATGKFLLLNKSMVAGERLDVEITHDRTYVTSSADGECRGALALTSSFFRLGVGDNVLKPEADSGRDNMQVDLDFSTEVVGVVL